MELREIVEELQKIKEEKELKDLTDDVLFTCAVKIMNTEKMNASSDKITSKQKYFLEKNGYEGDIEKLSKKEASQIIKEAIERQKGEKS